MDTLTNCADVECYDVPGSLANYDKCIEGFCSSEYMACIDQPASSGGSGSGSGSGAAAAPGIDSCLDVHEAVLEVCVPAYSQCVAGCNDQACADTCGGEMAACIEVQKNAAPAQAGQDFQAVLACRQANFNTCNSEADAVLGTCDAGCSAGDNACLDSCMAQSDEAYEACYIDVCANEYATCGITDGGDTASGGGATGGETAGSAGHDSCLAIYEAVQAVCDAGYMSCTQACGDQACADQCAADANACVTAQIESADDANDGADYEAVLGCWNTHYETCYAEGAEIYETCLDGCTDSEEACGQACNEPAMGAYAGCYAVACSDEYATCGIQ